MKTKQEVAQAAIDAVNNVAMAPELSYEDTRTLLLGLQKHIDHLLTHFPSGQHLNTSQRTVQ